MSFDWVLSSQWETTKDDEEEDEVGKVRMVNEVVTCDSEAGQTENQEKKVSDENDVLTERIIIFCIYLFHFYSKRHLYWDKMQYRHKSWDVLWALSPWKDSIEALWQTENTHYLLY